MSQNNVSTPAVGVFWAILRGLCTETEMQTQGALYRAVYWLCCQRSAEMNFKNDTQLDGNFAERVQANQRKLRSNLNTQYDFIICGSGSAGSVVASRLAENTDISVLLLEAGGDDDVPSVTDARQWVTNIGSERYWEFNAEPNPHLNGRAIPMGMGKVLGGGSSISAMIWARGHKSDWDYFASETGDSAWGYESVLDIYRRIEDWQGAPDPGYRGTGGPVCPLAVEL